jgi:hypothetical protein
MKKIIKFVKSWWKRHICDVIPEDDEIEFSDKFRK